MDPKTCFPDLPDEARLWSFGVGRTLRAEEVERLLGAVDRFLGQWKAHGAPLAAARAWVEDRFLLVAVDERVTPPSGCSIDALVRILKGFEETFDTDILGGGRVWYRDPDTGQVVQSSRTGFRDRAGRGELTPDTTVFDPSLTRVGDLRAGRWEGPAHASWHRRYFETAGRDG